MPHYNLRRRRIGFGQKNVQKPVGAQARGGLVQMQAKKVPFKQRLKRGTRAFLITTAIGGGFVGGAKALQARHAARPNMQPRAAAMQMQGRPAAVSNQEIMASAKRVMAQRAASAVARQEQIAGKRVVSLPLAQEPNFRQMQQHPVQRQRLGAVELNPAQRRQMNSIEPNLTQSRQMNAVQQRAVQKPIVQPAKNLKNVQFPYVSENMSIILPKGTPCVAPALIEMELKRFGSPAAGYGEMFVKWGKYYRIRPEVAMSFFRRESSFGTKGLAVKTKGIGNIRYTPPPKGSEIRYSNYKGFRSYPTWEDGIKDFFRLVSSKTYAAGGRHTIADVIDVYAPASENDTAAYKKGTAGYIKELFKKAKESDLISLLRTVITRKH